jgi:predicted acyltransferase
LRFVILFILGIVCYSIDAGKPVLKLWNILTQVSVAYLLTFLIVRTRPTVQIIISFSLILVSQLIYFLWNVEGYNQPFVAGQNFGTWWDMKLMGITEGDHWVSFNVVATSSQVIWGSLAGSVLLSRRTPAMKLKVLLISGIIGIAAGLALSPLIPFIKKIATASVIIETGGWCFVMLAFSYWLVDLKLIRTIPGFFAVVGMNSLFIYFLFQIGFGSFLEMIALPFSKGLFFWAGEEIILYVNALLTWFMLWYLCYFLHKKKIFIRI